MPEWPDYFQPHVVREGYGGKLSSYTIALEAWRRDLEVRFLDPDLRQYTISDGDGEMIRFIRSRPHMTTRKGVQTANDKHLTTQLLRRAGVPAPASERFKTSSTTAKSLGNIADQLGYPLVLKPLDGSMGKGVFAGIQNEDQLQLRYADLMNSVAPEWAMLEAHVLGDDFRVLVYDTQVVGVCMRLPANVVGDGQQTVQELIAEKNSNRKKNPFLSKGLIKPDLEVDDFLSRQNQTYQTIPARGQYVRLRSAANASAGGDVVDMTDEFPETIKKAAIHAVQTIPGLYCAGVDVLFDRDAESLDGTYNILELNAHPQIGVNMYPTQGTGQDAPKRILDTCFPQSKRTAALGDRTLSLPHLQDLLWPLKTDSADAVTLRPLPEHRLETRQVYTIDITTSHLTLRQRNRLRRAARQRRISGHVKAKERHIELLVAGDASELEAFVATSAAIIGANPEDVSKPQKWNGPISVGFQIAGL